MRQIVPSILSALLLSLLVALLASGCGSKKPKSKTSGDADAGVGDAGQADEEEVDEEGTEPGTEPEPEPEPGPVAEPEPEPEPEPVVTKGPAVFPKAPANNQPNRQPKKYLLSIKKAQIVPGKPGGECWDDCSGEAQMAIGTAVSKIGALPPTSQSGFDYAGKALNLGVSLVGGTDSFPDVFVHIRCGHGQGHKTNVAKNKMVATWRYENKKFNLDERDECVISVWDKDDDGDEELGRVTVPLVQKANAGGGKAILYSADEGFGFVYSLEIGLKPVDVSGGGGASGGGGSSTGTPSVPKGNYSIEIVKAKIKKTKKDGSTWDVDPKAKEGGGLLASLAGKAGGKEADVFVEAWKNGYKSQAPFMTTAIKKENYYPVWNETGGMSLSDTDHINFMVWDKDLTANDLIGECKTKPMGKQYTGEVWLKAGKGCGGQVEYLLVKITKN